MRKAGRHCVSESNKRVKAEIVPEMLSVTKDSWKIL